MGKMTTTTNKTNPSITWYGLIVAAAAAAAANSSLILFNLNLFYLVVVVVVVLFCSGIRKCTGYKTVNEYIDCIWCIA